MRRKWDETLADGIADAIGREGRSRIWTPDLTARQHEARQRQTSLGGFALDRRGFVLQGLKLGGAAGVVSVFPACTGGMEENVEPDGSFEAPYTREKPGADSPDKHFPVVYPALVDDTSVRLWIEVLDANAGVYHPQEQAHYVKQIVVQDEFGNEIASGGFRYDNDARLVTQIDIPQEVTSIRVLEECNLHGWWVSSWSVEALKAEPVGDLRRPYTNAKPGEAPQKHVPLFGKRPNGDFSIEIGERSAEALHPMAPDHYEGTILVFDQYSQLRAGTYLDPAYNAEPVYDFDPIGGTQYVRVVAWCNLHEWWEAVYKIQGA